MGRGEGEGEGGRGTVGAELGAVSVGVGYGFVYSDVAAGMGKGWKEGRNVLYKNLRRSMGREKRKRDGNRNHATTSLKI